MATWQTDWVFIPRKLLIRKYGDIPASVPEEHPFEFDWSESDLTTEKLVAALPDALKAVEEVCPGCPCYGSIDGNGLRVHVDKTDRIDELTMRIDLRELTEDFLVQLIDFVKRLDIIFIPETNQPVDLKDDPDALKRVIDILKKSNAYKFVKDPYGYLGSLKEE